MPLGLNTFGLGPPFGQDESPLGSALLPVEVTGTHIVWGQMILGLFCWGFENYVPAINVGLRVGTGIRVSQAK